MDLNAIMVILKKMIEKVDEYGSGLACLRRDIQELHTSLPVLSAYAPRPLCSDCLQQPPPRSRVSSLSEIPNCSREREKTTEQPSASTSNVPDWAAVASTPYAHVNRYDALRSTDDDEHSDAPQQASSFVVVPQSRRARRRHRQPSSMNQGVQQPQQPQHQQQQQQPARSRVMLGKSTNADSKISAAKQIRKKLFSVSTMSILTAQSTTSTRSSPVCQSQL